jgi:hypothetical protein
LSRARDVALGGLLALLVLGGNVAWVSARLGFLHKPKQVREFDHYRYIEMARGPAGRPEVAGQPPYCWRVLIPGLARGLQSMGVAENLSFFLITNAALFGFLLTLWLYLADRGFALELRVTALLLLGFTQGAVRWFEYQYWMTDPACVFLLMLAVYWIGRERDRAFAGLSVVAALVRETYVVVYPYYFLRLLKRGRPFREAALRTAAIAALPFLILVALRVAIRPSEPDDFVSAVTDSLAFRLHNLTNNQPYVLTVGTFGAMFPLLVMFPGRVVSLCRRHFDQAGLLACVYLTLVISNNTERPLVYALPVVVPAALYQLRALSEEARIPLLPLCALTVALQAFLWTETHFLEMGSSIYQPTNLAVVAAMTLFWLAGQAALRVANRRAYFP